MYTPGEAREAYIPGYTSGTCIGWYMPVYLRVVYNFPYTSGWCITSHIPQGVVYTPGYTPQGVVYPPGYTSQGGVQLGIPQGVYSWVYLRVCIYQVYTLGCTSQGV